jgi:hypothetical protein
LAQARSLLESLSKPSDTQPIRAQLRLYAQTIIEKLSALARSLPPATITLPDHPSTLNLDDAIRCLDASERASFTSSIDLVDGDLDGVSTVVKSLRLSGACAWWVTLDEQKAGTLSVHEGKVHLITSASDSDRRSIVHAIAIIEGRRPAQFELLPVSEPLALSPSTQQPEITTTASALK